MLGGGTDGNAWLTAATGVLLIGLLAALGVTILRVQQLIWLHLFLGLLLVGPILLKMASTGYRFLRYYMRSPNYLAKGPPHPLLRVLGPGVVLSTMVVFVSGIVLMLQGPAQHQLTLLVHKASFIVWLALTGLHVLGHLPELRPSLMVGRSRGGAAERSTANGAAGRWIVLIGAVVAGAVLAVALLPHFLAWTASGALPQHGDH